ncbi:hypothetical protein BD779DRAFT_1432710 [Infundibulicybe gibba]|nr:hypothetical protein BD779DRAFT_1432710 [Infundibulicybe gibba]
MEPDEIYTLLLLSDSNLPTGSFVASSGFESYVKHGFTSSPDSNIITFIRDSLGTYGRSALPFVSDAHRIVTEYKSMGVEGNPHTDNDEEDLTMALTNLTIIDELYETMTLNHVARRASKAQGVALLTLYSKGFSRPPVLSTFFHIPHTRLNKLIDRFKLSVRREDVHGHFATCWGILTAALGLSLERSQYLHLFLHARSLLSAAIRLNDIGPYNAQQILLHAVQPLVIAEAARCKDLRTGSVFNHDGFDKITQGPANTWPLGEILAARHDLQHSRIFNS